MTIVIFGGAGDLAHRKLLPALYNLHVDGLLPPRIAIAGVGRKAMPDQDYRAFAKEGVAQFGSGWVWLVADDDDRVGIEKTPDAVTPMAEGKRCLLTIDVWEHAYYLDYQNRRPDFLEAVIGKLLNWDFAMQNFLRAG